MCGRVAYQDPLLYSGAKWIDHIFSLLLPVRWHYLETGDPRTDRGSQLAVDHHSPTLSDRWRYRKQIRLWDRVRDH